jgi:hypothetical protein
MTGHNVLYKKPNETKLSCINNQEQQQSPPFVGAVQPAGWQGTTSYTKEGKKNNHAVTIDTNSDPVLLSFRRRRSTGRMAGHDDYYKRTKENDQAATINNNSETRAKVCVVVVVELE